MSVERLSDRLAAAHLATRRNRELQRRERIFNSEVRTIGVGDALCIRNMCLPGGRIKHWTCRVQPRGITAIAIVVVVVVFVSTLQVDQIGFQHQVKENEKKVESAKDSLHAFGKYIYSIIKGF